VWKKTSLKKAWKMNDYQEARDFLDLLHPHPPITFQTFANSTDSAIRPEILYGTIDQHWDYLRRANDEGAGVYGMVNTGDGVWRSNENVTGITNCLLDLDGSPLDPVLNSPIKPHAIIETSPGHYQVWWKIQPLLVTDANRDSSCELFRRVQRGIADQFGGDRHVSGLSGVARIPGFLNMKNSPFLIRALELNDLPEYPITALIHAFGIDLKDEYRRKAHVDLESLNLNLVTIPDGKRNTDLFNIVRKIGYAGILGEDLLDIGMHINDEYCDPPKSDDHVKGLVCRINEYCLRKSKKRPIDHEEYVDLILQIQHLVYSQGYFFRFYTETGSFRILDKRALVNRVFQASDKKASRMDIDEVLLRVRGEISNRLPAHTPEVEFIRTMLEEGREEDRCSLETIHARYKSWCLSRDIKPLKKSCLSAEIELRTGKAPKTVRRKEAVFWGYVGLCLR
jgi:hypothetical protein